MAIFVSVQNDGKKMKKLSQFLKSHILEMLEAILLKFGIWNTDISVHVHSKNCLVSQRKHGTMNA